MSATGLLADASVIRMSLDPDAGFEELTPLAALIGDRVRIVAIGESTHGAGEFYRLRHRLARFLVERMGFTALVWESGFPEGLLVDGYVTGCGRDREAVLAEGMTMHLGRCDEMGALLDWLRAHNASRPVGTPAVRFYGLDLPGSGASLSDVLGVALAYAEEFDPGFAERASRLRELGAWFKPEPPQGDPTRLVVGGTATVQQYAAQPVADRNELTATLADLLVRFDALRRVFIERSGLTRYDLARQHLRVATQFDLQLRAVATYMGGDTAACEANIRDLTMADTVEWILQSHERVVVLAHNGHIQKTPIATYAGPIETLGAHLAARRGAEYLVIGTTCGRGEVVVMRPETIDGSPQTTFGFKDLPPAEADVIDGVMESSFAEASLVDLRTLEGEQAAAVDATRRMRLLDQFTDIEVRKAFDMLIHVPRISLWTSTSNKHIVDMRDLPSTTG
jgi:erythromycin esterase